MSADASEKRKMSGMISGLAANFIRFGRTPEEKEARLTAACSCLELGLRLARIAAAATGPVYRTIPAIQSAHFLNGPRQHPEGFWSR